MDPLHTMPSKAGRLIFVVTLIWSLGGRSLLAQQQLDQFYEPGDYSLDAFVGVGATQMQTFTVGTSGFLTEVQFYGQRSSRITDPNGIFSMEIRRTFLGSPIMSPSGLITSTSVPFAILPLRASFIPFEFSNAPFVEVGQTFTIVLKPSANLAFWFGDSNGDYNGGLYFSAPAATGHPDPMGAADLGFRTFIQTVPEPATGILFASGLSLFILFRQGIRRSNRNEVFVTSRLAARGHGGCRGLQPAEHPARGPGSSCDD